ncbi:hypothetical protein LRB11_16430 [Ectothiorhodospira haloalkaliphila]|uniref:hypothetical protein n=1 Tax=Ectothiorhodospira haloalkaliphila TaxID=421628 RepID=UPI001EE81CAD|nr:hypothetical protein [Ectothiorhodospira haloalkaliphila]MCG5526491.1 hypothetical protein [Ectothiorhodospira haloalkaliphila]
MTVSDVIQRLTTLDATVAREVATILADGQPDDLALSDTDKAHVIAAVALMSDIDQGVTDEHLEQATTLASHGQAREFIASLMIN